MNWIKKIQKFLKKNSNYSMALSVIFIFIGYLFFFNSKTIFKYKEAYKNTNINSVVSLDNRNITLSKWVYCQDTKEMEIELDIVNSTYDGNDNYVYQVINRKGEEYETTVMLTSPTISVIRVKNIPSDFTELRLSMKVNYGTSKSKEPAKFYVNNDSVEQVSEIVDYTNLDDYYVAKLNRYISDYENEISENESKIADTNKQVDNYNELISNLNMQKSYAAGDELNNINKQISDVNKQLISLNNDIRGYESNISDIKKKISDYDAIKKMYE